MIGFIAFCYLLWNYPTVTLTACAVAYVYESLTKEGHYV